MPQAPNYTPTTGFATDETNQAAGRSTVKTASLDAELANISTSINALNTNLKKIQRDDGKIVDGLIEPYQLAEQSRALIATGGRVRGIWAANTQYFVGEVVQSGPVPYLCYKDHTSGLGFIADGFWIAISGDGQSMVNAAASSASAAAAATSASNAATSASSAATSASTAASNATTAVNNANAAANSASAAASNAAIATSAANNAALIYDQFDDRYLGAFSTAPTLDNDGNAIQIGALYFSIPLNSLMVYGTTGWIKAGGGAATGAGSDAVFFENDQVVTTSYTITAGKNAVTTGPLTFANGVNVTVPDNSNLVIL